VSGTVILLLGPPVGTKRYLQAGQETVPDIFGPARPVAAEACWRRILTLKRPDQFCSVDHGIYGHLTLRNLAVLAEERGDRVEAQRLWSMDRLARKVPQDTANPAPKRIGPGSSVDAPFARPTHWVKLRISLSIGIVTRQGEPSCSGGSSEALWSWC